MGVLTFVFYNIENKILLIMCKIVKISKLMEDNFTINLLYYNFFYIHILANITKQFHFVYHATIMYFKVFLFVNFFLFLNNQLIILCFC